MKKRVCILLAIVLLLQLFCGCGAKTKKADGLHIVTTIFPVYDWVMNMLGEQADTVEVTMLLDKGVDLHSYQPTAADLVQIATCDLFVYVGGESDAWAEDALKEARNPDMIVINLMDTLSSFVKEEELVEGMEAEEEEEEAEEGPEYDEHIWLSLRNASAACEAICASLVQLDGTHEADFTANRDAYCEQLNALDGDYQAAVDNAAYTTILFGDRFPFRYLADDYGLDYYAAFVGCSAESEASFETVAFLAGKLDELALPAILTLEGTDHKLAETILSTSESGSAEILTMDSMQSTTSEDVAQGETYLAVMEKNLEALKKALE